MCLSRRTANVTRSFGNKTTWDTPISRLHEVFSSIEFDSALDLFGGSTSVSYLLKRMGKRVACNDLLHCNYLAAVALIQNNSVRLDASFTIVAPPPTARDRYSVIRDRFGGFYFTDYGGDLRFALRQLIESPGSTFVALID